MSTPRVRPRCHRGSTPITAPKVDAIVAPKVGISRNTPAALPLDAEVEAHVAESERHPVPLAWAVGVVGMHGAFVGLCAILREVNALDVALSLGWSVAVARFAMSIAASPTEQSKRLTRHAAYRDGVRTPSRKPSAADRARAEARKWTMPIEQLLADRKAVA